MIFRRVSIISVAAAAMLGATGHAAEAPGWVTEQRISAADAEPGSWLVAGHDYGDTRFSPLRTINEQNVGRLGLAWYYDLDTHRGQEATPVAVDGVLYTTSAWSKVQAFRASTGELLWQFDPGVPGAVAAHVCCDVVNRGVAVWQGRVYVGTLDGRLIAIDARTGKLEWSVQTVNPKSHQYVTGAPRAFGNKVIIGQAGAERHGCAACRAGQGDGAQHPADCARGSDDIAIGGLADAGNRADLDRRGRRPFEAEGADVGAVGKKVATDHAIEILAADRVGLLGGDIEGVAEVGHAIEAESVIIGR